MQAERSVCGGRWHILSSTTPSWSYDETTFLCQGQLACLIALRNRFQSARSQRIPHRKCLAIDGPKFHARSEPSASRFLLQATESTLLQRYSCFLESGRQLLAEVEACEVLPRHPHPNIAQYLGCVTENGKVMGLYFKKYPVALSQKLKDGTPFNRAGSENYSLFLHICILC